MKIVKETLNGTKRRITVEIDASDKLVALNPSGYYTLGEPMQDDVYAGHILAGVQPVSWSTDEQKWVPQ